MAFEYQEKIARILRVDQKTLAELENNLYKATGKVGIIPNILAKNEDLIANRLGKLGASRNASAHEVYDALISKIEADDVKIFKYLGLARLQGQEAAKAVVDFVREIHSPATGLFLKKEKAKQLLIAEPPKNILKALGYKYVEEMLQKEDLPEIYSALRFLEDNKWQNEVFFKQYETLGPEDFEERPIELRALSNKWAKAAERFVAKKYHNVSHLKELGVIFVIPIFLGISGEALRLLSLLFHYLHEVKFYSDLFREYADDPKTFAANIISLLRGDVLEHRLPEQLLEARRARFLVVQRYLAKDDENDWRLFEPRINPEALHWRRAEDDMVKVSERVDNGDGMDFWKDTGWVGDFFKTDVGTEALVSFDLVDTVMALVKQRELIKYLYHHQEALWNKIFIEYFGDKKLEEYSRKFILKGWFAI